MHIDHVGGVQAVKKILEEQLHISSRLLYHKDASPFTKTIRMQAQMFGLNPNEYDDVPDADEYIDEETELYLGEQKIKILHTPGHALGHVSLYFDVESYKEETTHFAPFLIAGDTLFSGSIGRTDLPGGNHAELLRSIREKLLSLPLQTIVMSGHGPNTTIGNEKGTNYFLQSHAR